MWANIKEITIGTVVCITLAFMTMQVTQCTQQKQQITAQLKMQCFSGGGTWGPAQGTTETFMCYKK
jgi:hypothetical protein